MQKFMLEKLKIHLLLLYLYNISLIFSIIIIILTSVFPACRGWMGPMNAFPPVCTIFCHPWFQIQLLHVLFNTFQLSLSSPSSATFSFHLNISAGTYPLLSYHTLHVSKPTQSTSPHHLHHTLNTQTRAQVLLFLSDNFTPHIFLTIYISLRSSLLASSRPRQSAVAEGLSHRLAEQ